MRRSPRPGSLQIRAGEVTRATEARRQRAAPDGGPELLGALLVGRPAAVRRRPQRAVPHVVPLLGVLVRAERRRPVEADSVATYRPRAPLRVLGPLAVLPTEVVLVVSAAIHVVAVVSRIEGRGAAEPAGVVVDLSGVVAAEPPRRAVSGRERVVA